MYAGSPVQHVDDHAISHNWFARSFNQFPKNNYMATYLSRDDFFYLLVVTIPKLCVFGIIIFFIIKLCVFGIMGIFIIKLFTDTSLRIEETFLQ
jgi:hypothetical protein